MRSWSCVSEVRVCLCWHLPCSSSLQMAALLTNFGKVRSPCRTQNCSQPPQNILFPPSLFSSSFRILMAVYFRLPILKENSCLLRLIFFLCEYVCLDYSVYNEFDNKFKFAYFLVVAKRESFKRFLVHTKLLDHKAGLWIQIKRVTVYFLKPWKA